MDQQTGKIVQVIGPVVDVEFPTAMTGLPDIYESLEVVREDGSILVLECQQDIGENTVRTVAMDSTDGLSRGMEVRSTGGPIRMPIGDQIRGSIAQCDR